MLEKKGRAIRPDYIIMALLGVLVVSGLLMVYSASVVNSYNVSKNGNLFFQKQVFSTFFGILAFFLASKIHYTFWKRYAPLALALGFFLSLLVFVPGISVYHGGAKRWIDFGPINIQPSEFLKLGIILYFAGLFEKLGREVSTMKAFLPFIYVLGLSTLIVMSQPDMGTFLVIASISVITFFVAGASIPHITFIIGSGILGILTLIKAAPYRMQRFMVFLNPEEADKTDAGYQINQALIAIGTGGLFGLGFNQSRQKFQYLPEAQTDSIIAVMSEELGFIRMAIFFLIVALLVVKGFGLARRAPDVFSKLVIVGVISWVGVQSVLNVAAMLSLVPLTGIPFPFISYGGSSIFILLFSFGILNNISKHCSGRNI